MSELMLDEFHEEKRIKVRSAEIVVHGTLEKPYYEIKYQTTDGEWHIGYSSRKLEHVFWWLDNCFEIISYEQEIRAKAISNFADWCYINGIDFSYMSTSDKSGRQFIDDVIARYCKEQMKEERENEYNSK